MSYYDSLETRDPAVREADLMDKLRSQLAHAKQASTYYAHVLAGIDPVACDSRQALAALPLTRKRELIELQKATPPFGGLNALAKGEVRRVFASPGPIFELQGSEVDHWRMVRAL
ncbi:MAG TPA: phenylacetate--CoA ligase family protein, partial [Azonexus sp.]|nr:phenylacetate--CoA ligase family protein [Azonexus sp.]